MVGQTQRMQNLCDEGANKFDAFTCVVGIALFVTKEVQQT